jgi:hypothetical protein
MADGILSYDTGGCTFPVLFIVAAWTEKVFSGI